jgi:hypothetical protein
MIPFVFRVPLSSFYKKRINVISDYFKNVSFIFRPKGTVYRSEKVNNF